MRFVSLSSILHRDIQPILSEFSRRFATFRRKITKIRAIVHHAKGFVQNYVISRSFSEDSDILPESGHKTGMGVKERSNEALTGVEVQTGLPRSSQLVPRPLNSEQWLNQRLCLLIA